MSPPREAGDMILKFNHNVSKIEYKIFFSKIELGLIHPRAMKEIILLDTLVYYEFGYFKVR
jgi:hypothetical protein